MRATTKQKAYLQAQIARLHWHNKTLNHLARTKDLSMLSKTNISTLIEWVNQDRNETTLSAIKRLQSLPDKEVRNNAI